MYPPPAQSLPVTIPSPRAYEFDAAQNAVFTGLADAMKTVGSIMLALGVVAMISTAANASLGAYGVARYNAAQTARASQALGELEATQPEMVDAVRRAAEREERSMIPYLAAAVFGLIGALIPVTVGRSLRRAAVAFRAVATSYGSDIERVMDGVKELTNVYALGRIMVIYAVAIGLIVTAFAMRALAPS